jgi:hypothetical protein
MVGREFSHDNEWQLRMKERLLVPYYLEMILKERVSGFYFSRTPEDETHGDTHLRFLDGSRLSIEEKIVRWPGYDYQAITLETMSCTVPGRERPGWMQTADYNRLWHVKVSFDELSAKVVDIDFAKLQRWFWRQDFSRWKVYVSDQINKTRCLVVPYKDIPYIDRQFELAAQRCA